MEKPDLACVLESLSESISHQSRVFHLLWEQLKNDKQTELLRAIQQLKEDMAIKVSEIKTAVAQIAKNNKEAISEIGNRIADLNKQIQDLISGVGDPTVTDEAFETDLRELGTDSQALADIVPGVVTPPVA